MHENLCYTIINVNTSIINLIWWFNIITWHAYYKKNHQWGWAIMPSEPMICPKLWALEHNLKMIFMMIFPLGYINWWSLLNAIGGHKCCNFTFFTEMPNTLKIILLCAFFFPFFYLKLHFEFVMKSPKILHLDNALHWGDLYR